MKQDKQNPHKSRERHMHSIFMNGRAQVNIIKPFKLIQSNLVPLVQSVKTVPDVALTPLKGLKIIKIKTKT